MVKSEDSILFHLTIMGEKLSFILVLFVSGIFFLGGGWGGGGEGIANKI